MHTVRLGRINGFPVAIPHSDSHRKTGIAGRHTCNPTEATRLIDSITFSNYSVLVGIGLRGHRDMIILQDHREAISK